MPESYEKSGLRIEFEETGEVWDQITEYTINDSFTVDADQWEATVFQQDDPKSLRRKFLPLSRVKLYIGEKQQLVGRIKKTEGVQGSGALKIIGFDYFADLVAPGMDVSVRINSGMTLADALLEGLKPFGITEIETSLDEVISRKMGRVTYEEEQVAQGFAKYRAAFNPDTQAFADALAKKTIVRRVTEEVSEGRPQDGQGPMQWAQNLCSRYGMTVQPASKRSAIAVVQPDYSKKAVLRLVRGENVVDGSASRDWTTTPTVVAFRGKFFSEEFEASGGWQTLSPLDEPFGQIDEVRRIFENAGAVNGRLKKTVTGNADSYYIPVYHRDNQAKKQSELDTSTRRLLADRTRDTLRYTAYLDRVQEGGVVFPTNVLATVEDDVEDVNETMWVESRKLGYRKGEFSELKLIRPGSYLI